MQKHLKSNEIKVKKVNRLLFTFYFEIQPQRWKDMGTFTFGQICFGMFISLIKIGLLNI